MENILNYRVAGVSAGIGVIGGTIANWFGGWSTDLQTLLLLMAVDFLMGLLIATVWKDSSKSKTGTLQSNACFKGLLKKGVALLFVMIGHRLDITFALDYVRTGVIIAFITNELISIIENAGIMGIPMPAVVKNSIEILKSKQENGGH